jgi:hypothetical protein
LDGARHVRVGPLARADSVVFLERAIPAAQRQAADVERLAELCGDLPLALRIAAARVASNPSRRVSELNRRLEHPARRLRLLSAGDLAIEQAFEASYRLLSAPQQATFRDLAVLPSSSFSAAALGAVRALGEDDALEALEDLADLGLVESLGDRRYRLHDLIRLFVVALFEAECSPEERIEGTTRLERWYLSTAARAGRMFAHRQPADEVRIPSTAPVLHFETRVEAGAWLRAETDGWLPALRAAAAGGRHAEVLDAVAHVRWFSLVSLAWGRWHEVFALAAESARIVHAPALEARYLVELAFAYDFEVFDYLRAKDIARRGIALAHQAGELETEADGLNWVAIAEQHLGSPGSAEPLLRAALEIYRRLGLRDKVLDLRRQLAQSLRQTDPRGTIAELRSIVADLESHNTDGTALWSAYEALAQALIVDGQFEEAVRVATLGLRAAAADPGATARSYALRGRARLGAAERDGAREDLQLALLHAQDRRPQYWADEVEEQLRSIG